VILVWHEQRLVAALPLLETRWLGLKVLSLLGNAWSPTGELIIDQNVDAAEVCDALVSQLCSTRCSLLKLAAMPGNSPRWQAFWNSLARAEISCVRRPLFAINVAQPGDDWDRYFAGRSRAHRRRIRRAASKAKSCGDIRLVCHDALRPEQVEAVLRPLFEIEAAGWKGRQQTAVLAVSGVWQYVLAQAQQLAADGRLCLVVLEHHDRPIAFEYGWQSQGVYYSPKVAYDETYAAFAPGQLLRSLWLEQITHDPRIQTVDFLGPASPATDSWATGSYLIEGALVGFGPIGHLLVELYRRVAQMARAVRRWLGKPSATPQCVSEIASLASEREEADELVTASH
jgi:CelD/BcsL family acetyltransferase involved in cellulose biosynthesis